MVANKLGLNVFYHETMTKDWQSKQAVFNPFYDHLGTLLHLDPCGRIRVISEYKFCTKQKHILSMICVDLLQAVCF